MKRGRNALIGLLALLLFINYADRGLLSMAAPLMQSELHLTNTQLGVLFSAFFWTYALVQVPVGWLAERYGAPPILVSGLILWGAATLLMGGARGFAMIILLRMLLGLGESVGFPCVSKMLAMHVPVGELGVANGLVGSAYSFGPAVGSFLGGILMAQWGWRSGFVVFGAASLLWLWPWFRLGRRSVVDVARPATSPPLKRLLATPALWGTTLGLFCANYLFFFMMSWLPVWLVRERGFAMGEMTSITSASYVVMGLCSLLGGMAIDRYISRGGSPNRGYKFMMVMVHGGAVVCMLAMAFASAPIAVGCLFVYQALNGASASGLYAIPEILSGDAAAGRWVGIQNAGGSLAGVIAPWLTGLIVDVTGHFTVAFVLAALMSLIGLVGWVGLVPRLKAIEWRTV